MSFWRGNHSTIATRPLTGVGLALALAAIPLLDKVAPWAAAVFGVSIVLRLLVNFRQMHLPSMPVKIALLAIGIGGVAFTHGGLIGVEPGMGVLLVLLSLKLLETNTVRDFQVLVLLGWFLCLCGLFFSQELTRWLYLGSVALLLAASLIRFHREPDRGGFSQPLGLALKLLLQASPIVVLLFLFFPRSHGDFRFQFAHSDVGVTGMSDRLSPGSFASLTQNANIAFRAGFPDGKIPPLPQLYWRGAVLWRGDGLTWLRGRPDMPPERHAGQLDGTPIRQQIFLQPNGGRWLFALDRPASAAGDGRDSTIEPGGFLQSNRPILTPFRYDVTSRPDNKEIALMPNHKVESMRKPSRISSQVQALVDSWLAASPTDRDVIDSALRYFRREKFVYSLEPNTYGEDALTEFLFDRRSGFCEHYAAAFASLMRIAGIPARVVIGYHGGQSNGTYVIVHQFDAHAWAEVWIKGEGWQRIDPTNVVAPERISSGLESFLESQSAGENSAVAGSSVGGAGLRDLLREGRLVWDNLKYQWDLRVLNYDEETQRTFFNLAGLGDVAPPMIVVWLTLGILLVFSLLALWFSRARRERVDPLVRDYRRFCGVLAAKGCAREPWEGPHHFGERAAAQFPQSAEAIRKITAHFIAARYAQENGAAVEFRRAVRALPRLS